MQPGKTRPLSHNNANLTPSVRWGKKLCAVSYTGMQIRRPGKVMEGFLSLKLAIRGISQVFQKQACMVSISVMFSY